jgi:DNA-binding NarL/FixJ family response regulator
MKPRADSRDFAFGEHDVKRVYVLSSNPIFGQGVQELLAGDAHLCIVGRATDEEQALAQIETHKPDVVIVDVGDPPCDQTSLVVRILTEYPEIRVVKLSLQNNAISIFCKRQIVARSVDDLKDAIQDDERESDPAHPAA